MSSSYNLQLNSSSPTASKQQSTAGEADLFSKCMQRHHDNSPRSTAQFKKPSRKWKTVLTHLTPLRLLPAPMKSVTPLLTSSPSALVKYHLPPSTDTSIRAPTSSVDSLFQLLISPTTSNPCDSFPFSFEVANDVEKLLHICLETPASSNGNIINCKRTHTLAALCALCVSSPNNAKRCAVAGGVRIVIEVLNNTVAQPSREESEKAVLLLQILTSSSEDGCIAALLHSSSIITTLGKKLLRVSESCTASAIAVLTTLCRRSDAARFKKSVSETAIPSKLVVVLQVASKDSTKRRVSRLLRLLEEQQQHTLDPHSSVNKLVEMY